MKHKRIVSRLAPVPPQRAQEFQEDKDASFYQSRNQGLTNLNEDVREISAGLARDD